MPNYNPSNKKKKADVSIVLSTAPEDAPTHWQQVIALISAILVSFSLRYMAILKFLENCIANIHKNAVLFGMQTLLYLFEPIELKKDQIMEGSVTISQSQQHARFLNICLKYL
ncbi:unnamed protein product [Triticum turgidum subsp. durum]|uniref:Protein arginine N-methyltransferase domain-containing protein n=1 Tax=Triticum turgidum subsp. durum TaxID=4567 RepID=A0A9R0V5S6_TRITD|nr:unnamed protein product [Triticum turgidum subsp. durum]